MSSLLQEAAKRLGLTYDNQPGTLALPHVHGEIDGHKVRSVWGDRAQRVDALLEPPLDLGLRISGRNFVLFPTIGRRVTLNDSNWDDEVDATADEPSRAAVLFAGETRGAVLRLNATSMGFEVTDEIVGAYSQQFDVSSLVAAFTQVARVATHIEAARRAVPAASRLTAHAAALRALGREHGLRVEETPLRIRGEVRGARLVARFVRTATDTFDLDVRVSPVEEGPGAGLHVRPETTLDRVRTFFGGQDLRTGDAAFDPAFLVQAREQERGLAALDGDVRAMLLELRAKLATVSLDDAALTLRGPAGRLKPEDVTAILETACTVVENVARANAAVLRGPYR